MIENYKLSKCLGYGYLGLGISITTVCGVDKLFLLSFIGVALIIIGSFILACY